MKDVKQGDMVWVSMHGRKSEQFPVAKVGRTLVHVSIYGRTETFRLDTGQHTGGRGSTHFYTEAERLESQRSAAALAALKEAGFEPRLGRRPPLALLEALAEVAKAFGTEKEG